MLQSNSFSIRCVFVVNLHCLGSVLINVCLLEKAPGLISKGLHTNIGEKGNLYLLQVCLDWICVTRLPRS